MGASAARRPCLEPWAVAAKSVLQMSQLCTDLQSRLRHSAGPGGASRGPESSRVPLPGRGLASLSPRPALPQGAAAPRPPDQLCRPCPWKYVYPYALCSADFPTLLPGDLGVMPCSRGHQVAVVLCPHPCPVRASSSSPPSCPTRQRVPWGVPQDIVTSVFCYTNNPDFIEFYALSLRTN